MKSMTAQLIGVVASGIAAVIVAFVWYSSALFGGYFGRVLNLTPEQQEAGKKKMPINVFIAFLSSVLIAYVMSFMMPVLVVPDWIGALELGVWCWIGFTAPPMLGMVLWEGRPFRYYLIVSGYWLVTFIVMSLIVLFTTQITTAPAYQGDMEGNYGYSVE